MKFTLQVSRKYGIETPVYIAELDFENVFLNIKTDIKFKELPKYPAVTRDIAMLVDKTVPVADIENVIKRHRVKYLKACSCLMFTRVNRYLRAKRALHTVLYTEAQTEV